jgi:hypothetical protein
MIGIEKCGCGHPSCKDYWLTGVGKFVRGSGFTEDEAREIAALLNASRRQDAPSAGEGSVDIEPWGHETGKPFASQPTARALAEAICELATNDRMGLEQRVRGLILRDRATVRQRWEGVQRRAEDAETRAGRLEAVLEAFRAALPAPPQADGGEG